MFASKKTGVQSTLSGFGHTSKCQSVQTENVTNTLAYFFIRLWHRQRYMTMTPVVNVIQLFVFALNALTK
jgi:hypothetical protein